MKKLRYIHKWFGIVLSFILILFVVSGIIMNHRGLFSTLSVSRDLLPSNYNYNNWNQAALKSGVELNKEYFLYGNLGLIRSNSELSQFETIHLGEKKGIDTQKTFKILKTKSNHLLSAGFYGLYLSKDSGKSWTKTDIPAEHYPIDVIEYKKEFYILTRSEIHVLDADYNFNRTIIPGAPAGYDQKIGLFRTLWEIHSGEFLGIPGQLFVDFIGLIFLLIGITGIIYFFSPKSFKKYSKKIRENKLSFKRKNLKWHNWLGVYLGIFLLFTTLTGMFLRPPLLIPIANSRVDKLKFTHLDHPNPWFDKLRSLHIDQASGKVFLGTNEGIYIGNDEFTEFSLPKNQAPISVMGITVFEEMKNGYYLVGSFSGLYLWNPDSDFIVDYISKVPYLRSIRPSNPISDNMIAGYMKTSDNREVIFDYNRGAYFLSPDRGDWVEMPTHLIDTPMSLWNLALEVHTGRIFESILGLAYILYIPLVGLNIILLLVSGFLVWNKYYRKKKNVNTIKNG